MAIQLNLEVLKVAFFDKFRHFLQILALLFIYST